MNRPTFPKRAAALLCALLLLLLCACAKTVENEPEPAPEKDSVLPEATEAPALPVDDAVSAYRVETSPAATTADSSLYTGGTAEMEAADGSPALSADAPRRDDAVSGEPAASPAEPGVRDPGEAFVLTAAEWNDNRNWPFFTNLVNSGAISFPSFGIDPRNRIEVRLTGADGAPLRNEAVSLHSEDGAVLWTARTDKGGTAYLFFPEDSAPALVQAGGVSAPVSVKEPSGDQGEASVRITDAVELTVDPQGAVQSGMQVMFIVDTTGSMSDEIAYLQKDFSSIAMEVAAADVEFAACFYRDKGDEYVTKCNRFTPEAAVVQAQINAEYADGGGDAPEAVAQILTEAIAENEEWREDRVKLAFLIFDAPPHEGTEDALQAAVTAAAQKGIRVIPVVASNADRETELFGRALAICTGGSYVFLTDDSGVGDSHLEPIVGSYQVELLHDIIVRLIRGAA